MSKLGNTEIKALRGVVEDYYVYFLCKGYKPEFVRRFLRSIIDDHVSDMEEIIK